MTHTHVLINFDDGMIVAVVNEEETHDWENDDVVDFYMNIDANSAQD
jgi:hypothetical protein